MFILGPMKLNFLNLGAHQYEKKHHNKSLYNKNYIRELSPMFTIWSLNFNGGMPLVKGSVIINLVLMCSITTFFSLTRSLMARFLMSMCLLQLPLLLFLAIKTPAELSQYMLNGLDIESIILSPEMKLLSHTPCEVASK